MASKRLGSGLSVVFNLLEDDTDIVKENGVTCEQERDDTIDSGLLVAHNNAAPLRISRARY
jgi:hypothetical protein